jgi:hypothetical protein
MHILDPLRSYNSAGPHSNFNAGPAASQAHQDIKVTHGKELSPDDLILACSMKVQEEQQQQQGLGSPPSSLPWGLMVLSNDRMLRIKVRWLLGNGYHDIR